MRILKTILVSTIVLLSGFGCSEDSSVEPIEEEHIETESLVIIQKSEVIVRYINGDVWGILQIGEGERTPLLSVKFVDPQTDTLFTPDEDEYNFEATVSDEMIATFERFRYEDWAFYIHGQAQGATDLIIRIMHGDHADFESLPIPILVSSKANSD